MSAAAKSLQSCLTLCDPMECSPPGFSVHGILQARTLEWVAISFSTKGYISFLGYSRQAIPHLKNKRTSIYLFLRPKCLICNKDFYNHKSEIDI